MPINPQTYEGVAYGLSEAGAQVTYEVAEALTELHKAVIENPENLSRAADIYAQHVAKACAKWEKDWRKWADEGLLEAYIQGVKHTDAELAILRKAGIRVHPPTEPIPEGAVMVKNLPTMTLPLDSPKWMKEAFVEIPNHLTAFNVFRRAAYFALEGTSLQIIRKGNDLYRDVAIQAGSQMFREADIFTRRQFSQRMLDDFAKRGIQAITYSNGRKMSIEAYAEMVGRTMSGHAAVQGSLNRYAEHGYNLVRVSAHFRACELCVPYEGRILSLDGRDPNYESLDSAISQGLFHPNCSHDVSPYIPGLSPDLEVRVSKEEQALIDQYGYKKAQEIAYKAQVQQRYIERQIRFWKKRELTSLDPAVKASAHRKVLDWQKAQREHLQLNPFLPRKYDREGVPGWKDGRMTISPRKVAVVKAPVTRNWIASTLEEAERFGLESGAFTTLVNYTGKEYGTSALMDNSVETANVINNAILSIKDKYRYGGPLSSVNVKRKTAMSGANASMRDTHLSWRWDYIVAKVRPGRGISVDAKLAKTQAELIRNTAIHEYAHAIHWNIVTAARRGDESAKAILAEWDKICKKVKPDWRAISPYAASRQSMNPVDGMLRPESFAEAFTAFELGAYDRLTPELITFFRGLLIQ